MTSFYSYNVLKVDDKAAFLSHIRRLQPAALLFYADQLDFARQVKAEFPDMVVILRNWPDSELYVKQSPKSWLDAHESQAAGGLYLYSCNESGLSKENIQWHLDLMDLSIQRGIHLVLLNPATGTWDTSDFPVLKPLLIKAAQHRDLFIIGLHEYAGGVITSGIAGGYPDNAGVAPGQPGGKNLIPREKWPTRDEIIQNNWTTFHLGRHKWIINYCKSNNIPLPRFALTETGFDYLGDIGQWLNGLDHSGYSSINGWQTLKAQWIKWWQGYPDEDYVIQFKYASLAVMEGLEFALLYCYGDDGHWFNYDVSKSDIPSLLETMTPAPTQPPFDYGAMTKAKLINNGITVNLRSTPSIEKKPLAELADGAQIEISSNALKSGDYSWYQVNYQGMTGYIADTQNWRISAVSSEPPPVDKKATVIIRIKGLTIEAAKALVNNVEISIE